MLSNFSKNFGDWLKSPIDPEVTPSHIFLVTGLYIVAIVFWLFVLNHLIRAVKAAGE